MDRNAVIEALRRYRPDRATAIDALADVSQLRAAVDDFERDAIDAARAGGASWAEVAAALGLASRQAAEQRRSRLGGAIKVGGVGQRDVDSLKRALENLAKLLEDAHTGPVALARQTIAIALEAPPGQLIDLARLAVEDLERYATGNPKVAAARTRVIALMH